LSGPRVATIGEIVLDEVVHEGGSAQHMQLGGGAIYSAIGALMWGARPEIHAVVGSDIPPNDLERVRDAGIDLSRLTRRDGPGLGLWMLYERSGRRQQTPKVKSPTMLEIDLERRVDSLDDGVLGVHIAPQTTEGQRRALDQTQAMRTRTLDAMVETYIDIEPYRTGAGLRGITAFLPSEHEIAAIWGQVDPVVLARNLFELSGLSMLVITRGEAGVDVVDRDGLRHIPSLERVVIDPTGAGDAFAGGFLVGLVESGDPMLAALYGTVSASFVVETSDAVAAIESFDRVQAGRRLNGLMRLISQPAHGSQELEVNR
jgi:ribokinase